MAAWRYKISLLVLKKYFTRSLRSLVKYFFNTRREISYLRAAMQYPLFSSPSLPTPTPRYISCSHFFVPSTTIWTPGTGNNKSHWLDNDLRELNLNCGLAWCLTMSLSNPKRLWMVVPSPQFTYMTFIYPQLQSKIRATFWVYGCN